MSLNCKCGEPAEVRWTANKDSHDLCCNCMSKIWDEITTKYKGSNAYECSRFESISH